MGDLKIPKGYKLTEVGVIPEDWKSCSASEVINFLAGYSFSSKSAQQSGIRWLKIANVGLNEIKWDAESYLPFTFTADFENYLLKPNDIVMALTRPLLGGNLKVAKLELADSPALLNQRVAKLEAVADNSPIFMYYIVQRLDFIAAMNLAMAGSDPPNIGTKALGVINIPVPPTKEQTAIANALSDVDALISSLERLINKKQAIKTASMQQLLTGKTRLPQFAKFPDGKIKGTKQSELGEVPEDWEVKNIGSLCTYQNGTTQEKYFNQQDGYTVISIGNYSEHGKFVETGNYIDRGFESIVKKFVLKKDDLAMILNDKTAIGTIIGRVLLCDADDKYVINQRSMRLTTNGIVTPKYLHFLINSDLIHKNIVGMAKPGTQIYVNTDDVLGLTLLFPKDPEEQTAIATILSDMDTEIQTLEQRLSKTRQIKQGMMQELLTGKTRLV